MKLSRVITGITILCYLLGYIVPTTQGISIRTLFFLRHLAYAQRAKIPRNPASWGEWTLWSMCTTTEQGVRVRSRGCEVEPCNNLPGNNYEVQTCRPQAMTEMVQNETYLERCMNNPDMNSTLSCRLYRENPMMAYGIFRSAGHMHCEKHNEQSPGTPSPRCLFNVVGDMPNMGGMESEIVNMQELIFGRTPDSRDGERGLQFLEDLNTNPLVAGRIDENGRVWKEPRTRSLSSRVAESVPTDRLCTETCERLVLKATRITKWVRKAPSIQSVVDFLRENLLFRDNSEAILDEYNSCITTCSASGNAATYSSIRATLIKIGLDPAQQNPDIVVSLNTREEDAEESRNRRSATTQNNTSARNILHSANITSPRALHVYLAARGLKLTKENARIFYYHLVRDSHPGMSPRRVAILKNKFMQIFGPGIETPTPHPDIPVELETNNTDQHKGGNWTTKPLTTAPSSTEAVPLQRYKRQTSLTAPQINPDDFVSPCFERADETGNPRVINLDDTEGELFFYEGREQRFVRRKCVGSPLVPGKLFRAQEPVRQERTRTLAVCKQGFLIRYGLLIQLDRTGDFAFNDGERFSIKFKPFKLESHCALSVQQ